MWLHRLQHGQPAKELVQNGILKAAAGTLYRAVLVMYHAEQAQRLRVSVTRVAQNLKPFATQVPAARLLSLPRRDYAESASLPSLPSLTLQRFPVHQSSTAPNPCTTPQKAYLTSTCHHQSHNHQPRTWPATTVV